MSSPMLAASDWVAVASLMVALFAVVVSVVIPLAIATRISRRVEASVRAEQRAEVALQALLTELYGAAIPALRRLEAASASGTDGRFAAHVEEARRAHERLVPHAALVPDKEIQAFFYGLDWCMTKGFGSGVASSYRSLPEQVASARELAERLAGMVRDQLGPASDYPLAPSYSETDYRRRFGPDVPGP